jgi:hypothetical protein
MMDADGIVCIDGFRLAQMSISDILLVWAEIPELTASFSGPDTFADRTSMDATFDSALQGFTAINATLFKYQAPDSHPDSMQKDLRDESDPADRHPRQARGK